MHVFTYGSLMFPEVWTRVVRGVYRRDTATLEGYRRSAVDNETYPGIVDASEDRVAGIVYFDVEAADIETLDAFEGEDYRRIEVAVALSGGAHVDAQTYLFLPNHKLAGTPWSPENFRLDAFLASYCRFSKTD